MLLFLPIKRYFIYSYQNDKHDDNVIIIVTTKLLIAVMTTQIRIKIRKNHNIGTIWSYQSDNNNTNKTIMMIT